MNPDLNHPADEIDVLITRIVDREADAQAMIRFERLAEVESSLWRTLAMRQRDMALLQDGLNQATASAMRVELPVDAPVARLEGARRFNWRYAAALSGWAALIAVSFAWSMKQVNWSPGSHAGNGHAVGVQVNRPATPDSYDDHLRAYLQAPFVLGEMEPSVLDVEELPDGRVALRILRRIEEVAFINPDTALPMNDEHQLTVRPDDLRNNAAPAPQPN